MPQASRETIISASPQPSPSVDDLNPFPEPANNRPASFRSAASQTISYRHALLKGSIPRGDPPDLPVPPVLTRTNSMDTIAPSAEAQGSHGGHHNVPKVRLAVTELHSGRRGVSKVRSANIDTYEAQLDAPTVNSVKIDSHDGHFGNSRVRPAIGDDQHQTGASHIWPPDPNHAILFKAKIPFESPQKPFSEGTHSQNPRQPGRNYHEPKVRAMSGESGNSTVQPPSFTSMESEVALDDSKATSYWGFLPEFKGKHQGSLVQNTTGHGTSVPNPTSMIQNKHDRTNLLTAIDAATGAHNSSTAVGKRQLTPRVHTHEQDGSSPSVRTNQPKDGTVSSGSLPRSLATQLLKDVDRGSVPVSEDTRRTAQWLRDLLKSRKSTVSSLTKLPEKRHPRRQLHHDYPGYAGSTAASRVTTFSDENALDANTMEQAMQNLEQLLTKALEIANEVVSHDITHVDDGQLQSYLLEPLHMVDSHPPSIHESLLEEPPSEDEQPMRISGAMEGHGHGHGCEATSQRYTQRRGMATACVHTGKTRRPLLPPRESSLGHRKQTGKRKSATHYASNHLPMPPPDWQLRRDSCHPFRLAYSEDDPGKIIQPLERTVPNSREVREYIRVFHSPPITPRNSSRNLRHCAAGHPICRTIEDRDAHDVRRRSNDLCSLDGGSDDIVEFSLPIDRVYNEAISAKPNVQDGFSQPVSAAVATGTSHAPSRSKQLLDLHQISLRGRSHVSIRDAKFSLTRSHRSQPIARDWSAARKRFVAMVVCFGTAMIGMLLGIYAGIVPAVQYYIADTNHIAILGNVVMYVGMALPTFFCWPLPLLHGRRRYILLGLVLAMPLLFPQAIAISTHRSSKTNSWKWALLFPRGLMGISLGFANMNFHSTLTDLFGASLMSSNPHQEVVDTDDVRRHGGGLGVWLGIWTWCFIGSLGIGFLVGAATIDRLPPAWGFYISIILIAVAVIMTVLTPEVRRAAWRRSVAEVRSGDQVSRRVARGEVMMHRVKDGPKWWGQEMWHRAALSLDMLRQPGFAVMAIYSAWIYAQIVLIIVVCPADLDFQKPITDRYSSSAR